VLRALRMRVRGSGLAHALGTILPAGAHLSPR
jgi:hypothetical protein